MFGTEQCQVALDYVLEQLNPLSQIILPCGKSIACSLQFIRVQDAYILRYQREISEFDCYQADDNWSTFNSFYIVYLATLSAKRTEFIPKIPFSVWHGEKEFLESVRGVLVNNNKNILDILELAG